MPLYKKDSIFFWKLFSKELHNISSISWITYQERLVKLGLPSLEYRGLRADVKEVYKILNKINMENQEKLFTFAQYPTTTGIARNYSKKKKHIHSNICGHSFSNHVVNVWISLSDNVVLAPSLNSFKSTLNQFWHGHSVKLSLPCYIEMDQQKSQMT